ncbi:MAG TPA: MarR family transcriptional regulator [Pseudonocardiaceae bacterium]
MRAYDAAFGRLMELNILLNEDAERGMAKSGLTLSRAHLLWEVHHRGPVTQRVLSEALKVSSRNITGLVDGLVDTGFVTREPHPTDRRAILVTLTEAGKAATTSMFLAQQEFATTLFGDFDDAELGTLVAGLDKVLARLRGVVQGVSPS